MGKKSKLRAKYDEKHVELAAEVTYKANMEKLLGNFTTEGLAEEKKNVYMQQKMQEKHDLDKAAIDEKFPGFVIVQHVLETRHGESTWKEKGAGFSPNADISKRQVEGIHNAKTNQYTHHFLSNPANGVTMLSSTMLRAKRTALLMTPAHVTKLSFKLNKQFTEEGKYASSAAYTLTSGKKTRWGKFIGFVKPSILRQRFNESAEVDKGIRDKTGAHGNLHDSYNMDPRYQSKPIEQKNKEAVSNLPVDKKKKGQEISSPTVDTSEPDITFLSKGDKIAAINNSIINHIEQNQNEEKKSDLWVLFHGHIGKDLYKQRYGLEYKWDYLATKETYFLKGPDGKMIEYSPPGAIRVGVNGEFKGVFRKNERALVSLDFDRVKMLEDSKIVLDNKLKALNETARELKDLRGADPEILRINTAKLNEMKAFEPHTAGAEKKEVAKEIKKISEVIKAELNKTTVLDAKTAELAKMVSDVNKHIKAVEGNTIICYKEETVKKDKAIAKIDNKLMMRKSVKEKKISEAISKNQMQCERLIENFRQQKNASKTPIHYAMTILNRSIPKLIAQKANDQKIVKQTEEKTDVPQEAPRRKSRP